MSASLILYGFCIAYFVVAWRATMGKLFIATPYVIFAVLEMINVWPATIAGQLDGRVNAGPALTAAAAFIALTTGYLVAFRTAGGTKGSMATLGSRPLAQRYRSSSVAILLFGLAGVLVALGLVLYHGIPPVTSSLRALIHPNSGQQTLADLSQTKESLTKGYLLSNGAYRGQGAIIEIEQVGWTLVGATCIAMAAATRRGKWYFATLAAFACGAIFVGGVGQRFQIIFLLLSALCAATLVRRVKWRTVVVALGAMTLIIFLIAPLSSQLEGSTTPAQRAGRVAKRVFLGNGDNNMSIVQAIDQGQFTYGHGRITMEGLNLSAFSAILGRSSSKVPFAVQVALLDPNRNSQTTYATPTAYGFLYADFGPFGVIAGFLIEGCLLGWFTAYLARRRLQERDDALGFGAIVTIVSFLGITEVRQVLAPVISLGVLLAIYVAGRAAAAVIDRNSSDRSSSAPHPIDVPRPRLKAGLATQGR